MAAKAAPGSVQIEGATELRRAMKRMGKDLSDLTQVNREAAKPVLERAKEIVPRRSGTLGRSIRVTASRSGAKVLAGKNGVPYAGPIHFGWPSRNIESQPFLYDAVADRHGQVVDIYESKIGTLIRRLDAETPG
jgi:hypothetical protein